MKIIAVDLFEVDVPDRRWAWSDEVFGMPSHRNHPYLFLLVRTDDGLTEEGVLEFCSDKLARFKQPVRVHFVEIIPRNPASKILKRVLREQFPEAAAE